MKICFFPHYSFSNRDGATLSMYNIIDELLDRGHEIVVILPNKNHLDEHLKDGRIDYIYVPMYSMRMLIDKLTFTSRAKFEMKYIYNQLCVQKIVNLLKNKNINCIHINGLDSSVGAQVALKLNIPYVWHIRAFIEDDLGKKLCHKQKLYKYVKNANAVIGISKDIQIKFERELGRSVKLVYNGIPQEMYDLPEHDIMTRKEVKMLLAGRISVQKGQIIAVKAIEHLKNAGIHNVSLTLIGQGETKEYLQYVKEYIHDHDIEKNIKVMDHNDNLLEIRKEHDIGLICSQREAFGRVTVENMMAGLLVIGANSGGTLEIITDGEDGYLYEVDNSQNLADLLIKVLNNKEEARLIAKKGYKHSIEKYSIKRVVDEVLSVYREVTGIDMHKVKGK